MLMLITTTALDSREFHTLTHTPRPSELDEHTQCIRQATKIIDTQWEELSQEDREFFRGLARDLVDPPPVGIFTRLRLAFLVLRAGLDSFSEYMDEAVRLKETLLDVIEREHPDYDEIMTATVTEALNSTLPSMSSKEFRERLGLSDNHQL
jgi:hypothetical protein